MSTRSRSLQGLARAAGAEDSSAEVPNTNIQKFDPMTDPLGVGLMARARQHRWDNTVGLNEMPLEQAAHMSNTLPDPGWDAFYQALSEAGGGRPVRAYGSAGPDLGINTAGMGAGTEFYGSRGMRFNKV